MYKQLQNLSGKLIKQFGLPCVVRNEKTGKYNPETGEVESMSKSTKSAFCLFDNLAYDFGSSGQYHASAVQQGDVMLYITSEGSPTLNAKVDVDGETWAVINVQPIKPAGTAVIYQCQARKVK